MTKSSVPGEADGPVRTYVFNEHRQGRPRGPLTARDTVTYLFGGRYTEIMTARVIEVPVKAKIGSIDRLNRQTWGAYPDRTTWADSTSLIVVESLPGRHAGTQPAPGSSPKHGRPVSNTGPSTQRSVQVASAIQEADEDHDPSYGDEDVDPAKDLSEGCRTIVFFSLPGLHEGQGAEDNAEDEESQDPEHHGCIFCSHAIH